MTKSTDTTKITARRPSVTDDRSGTTRRRRLGIAASAATALTVVTLAVSCARDVSTEHPGYFPHQDRPRHPVGRSPAPHQPADAASSSDTAAGTPSDTPHADEVPEEQLIVIGGVVRSANVRDADGLASAFTADGTLNAFGDWGAHPVHQGEVIPTWMENIRAWDLATDRGSCEPRTETTVVCDVETRWRTLQIEIGERWTFVFDDEHVSSLVLTRKDLDPSDRSEPMSYNDLDAWEAWLEQTHPEQAAALLQRNSLIASFLRYDPTLADQIGASIREYLDALAKDPGRDISDQTRIVDRLVDAIEARDTDAFIDVFAPGAAFNPRGDFGESSGFFWHTLPIAQTPLVEAWMAINEAWGVEAKVIACHPDINPDGGYSDDTDWRIDCQVSSRWHKLSLEITEGWRFEFQGTRLTWWNPLDQSSLELLDLNPAARSLPLGYDGLEAWEASLDADHSADAARYLNPRQLPDDCDGCQQWQESLAPGDAERAAKLATLLWSARDDWKIDGHDFAPEGLIPYNPAFAGQIEASIQQYLENR